MSTTLERLKAEEAEAEAMFSNPTVTQEETPQVSQEFTEATTMEQTEDELDAAEYMEQSIVSPEPTEFAQGSAEEEKSKPKRTDWKKRFTNFKASADTTIYELRSEISSMKGQLALAYEDVRKLKDIIREAGAKGDPFEGVFSQEDEATFGADGLDVVKKATKSAIEKATKPLQDRLDAAEKARIDSLKEEATRSSKADYNRFLNGLANLVPDYQKWDTDPGFLKWMKLPDTYSGIPRASLFQRAEASRDVARVAEFFVEYSQLAAPKAVPSEEERHITPVGGGGATVTSAPQTRNKPRFILESEINKFYDDVMKGHYVGRHDEVIGIEAQIDAAMAEGRIRKG